MPKICSNAEMNKRYPSSWRQRQTLIKGRCEKCYRRLTPVPGEHLTAPGLQGRGVATGSSTVTATTRHNLASSTEDAGLPAAAPRLPANRSSAHGNLSHEICMAGTALRPGTQLQTSNSWRGVLCQCPTYTGAESSKADRVEVGKF